MKIDPAYLEKIREQTALRDTLAMRLGVAVFEHEQYKRGLLVAVERSVREETQLAMHALRSLGIDPDSGNFTIDKYSGAVICDGKPLERA
jgi:hypothetical protein